MTASVANGFAQVNYEPDPASCSQSPYAFHPMYSTSSEHTRVPWAAHSYNVAVLGRDRPLRVLLVDSRSRAATAPIRPADDDDGACFSAAFSLLVQVGGCIATRQRLRRHELPARLARHEPEPRAGREVPRGSVGVHEPGLQRDARTTHGWPSKPTCRGSRPPTSAGTATGPRERTASTRRRARNFYPIYTTGQARQRLLLAVRRRASPGHDEHVRRQLDRRVRGAPAERLPGRRVRASVPLQQLPADPEHQPLSGLRKEND